MTNAVLHVQMLGGFSLRLDDEPLDSIPARPRSLLAYLILHRDRDHTRDLLAGRFWSDSSDDKARGGLSQAMWHIRRPAKHTGIDLLAATIKSIRLNPELEVILDVEIFERRLDEFERLSRSTRRGLDVSDLASIIDSYRGELLAGHYDEWIGEERERLRGRYRAALRQLVSLTSNEGDYETALRHALALVAEEPLDELAQREVLRLYAMNGQPSVAERHFNAFAKEMKEQHIEPSAETVGLMQRISDDAAAPPSGFVELDQRSAALVGRGAERSALLNRVIDLVAGKGGVVLIEGEPGIGKSRLVEELAKGAEWRGAQVLVGRHTDTSALTPYEGLKQALQPATSGLRSDRLVDAVDPLWLVQAERVLDGLSGLVDGTGRQPLRPAEEPWRTAEALAQIILAQGSPKPSVLILEDVHCADEDTMAVLTQLGDRLIEAQVLVCLTYQLYEARQSEVIWRGLSAIEAEAGSSRLVVPPLTTDEAHDLIVGELGVGRLSASMAEQLIRSTGGNPYMLLELLRSPLELLDESIDLAAPEVAPLRIEERLLPRMAEIVTRRIDLMPDEVRSVLEGLAVIGSAASGSLVANVVGLDRIVALDGLQRAVDSGFLIETDLGCDFAQGQTRRVVYDAITVEQRRILHGRTVDAFAVPAAESEFGTSLIEGVKVEQVAHHAWLAGRWEQAHRFHALAAASALEVNAFQISTEHLSKADHAAQAAGMSDGERVDDLFEYERVLDILSDRSGQQRLLDRLEAVPHLDGANALRLVERKASLLLASDAAAAAEFAEAAVAAARAEGRNTGELLTILGSALVRSGKLSAARSPLMEAIEELQTEGIGAVEAKLTLGRTHSELRDLDAAHRYLEDAYDEATTADDVRNQVEALGHMATVWDSQGAKGRAEAAFREALRLAGEIGYRYGEGANLLNLGVFLVRQGRGGRAFDLFGQAAAVFASIGNKRSVAFVQLNNAWLLHWILGDDVTAKQQAEEAAVQLRSLRNDRLEAVCLNILGSIDRRSGQRSQARRRLTHVLGKTDVDEDPVTEAQTLLNLALVELELDRDQEALSHVVEAGLLRREAGIATLAAVLAAVEAKARMRLGQTAQALEATERVIRGNHPGADFAHLAAWWCAEVFVEAGQHEEASQQIALARSLLERHLEELPLSVVDKAWDDVPEHRAIREGWERYFVDELTVSLPSIDAPTGRPLVIDDFVSVTWTRSQPDDWQAGTAAERRRRRIMRMVDEATTQGAAPRSSDLAKSLGFSERTVKRDISILRSAGHQVATRRGVGENS